MTEMLSTPLLAPVELALVDRWQRGFPVVARPYAEIAAREGLSEAQILALLRRLDAAGVLSRVGATVRPNTAGASMLAAMRVPPARLEEVAAIVNREPTVNHNYERENEINLWFVVTGADRTALAGALARIRSASGLDVLELPLERSYFIDLGFGLTGHANGERVAPATFCPGASWSLAPADQRLLAGLADGLALASEPYEELARVAGLEQGEALERIARLVSTGIVTRLGLIVRHRALGFKANAMAVWDVADEAVDAVGHELAAQSFVTLCYRRPRRMPDWPYNLFCMVHGRERDAVRQQVEQLTRRIGAAQRGHAVLFSRRCFRQHGARLNAR